MLLPQHFRGSGHRGKKNSLEKRNLHHGSQEAERENAHTLWHLPLISTSAPLDGMAFTFRVGLPLLLNPAKSSLQGPTQEYHLLISQTCVQPNHSGDQG